MLASRIDRVLDQPEDPVATPAPWTFTEGFQHAVLDLRQPLDEVV